MSLATSGGKLVVDALRAHGVERVFCVPGESFLGVLDALYDVTDQLPVITCRHESGAAMMAAATAQLSGRPGVCFVTRGPGATNASIALHIARQASIPLVLGVGQVTRDHLGRESFQELDYEDFCRPLAKHVEQVTLGEALPSAIARAFQIARSDRPGPVVLALPEDILRDDVFAAAETPRPIVRRGLNSSEREALLEHLTQAVRPLILFGGGTASDASCRDLEQFAKRSNLPVCVAFRRNDAFDNRHPCYAGALGFNTPAELWPLLGEADCVLVLGARLDEPTTQGYTLFNDGRARTLIHIHPSAAELTRNYTPELALCADIGEVIGGLATLTLEGGARRAAWVERLHEAYVKSATPPRVESGLDPGAVMTSLNRILPDDAIVTIDAGNFTRWPMRYRAYRRPGRMLGPINGAMGWGVPAAVAACLCAPGRRVVCCVGDGGMLMTGQELATAMQYGVAPLIMVFNNARYGTIETHQDLHYPGRRIATELVNPDFAAYARAFGAFGARVHDNAEFDAVLPEALAAGRAALIELMLDGT